MQAVGWQTVSPCKILDCLSPNAERSDSLRTKVVRGTSAKCTKVNTVLTPMCATKTIQEGNLGNFSNSATPNCPCILEHSVQAQTPG